MRIAHFSDCYTPRINGVTTSIQVLKQALEAAGHEVLLFAPRYPQGNPAEAGLHRLPSAYMPLQPEDRMSLPAPGAWWSQRVDVVHVHTPFNAGWMGWWKSFCQRVPLVFTHHTLWEEYAHYLKGVPLPLGKAVGRGLCNFFFERSAGIVIPSQEVADALVGGRIRRPARVIPTGIYCQDFQLGDPRQVWEELRLEPFTPLFLTVGRMGKEKSVDVLLQVFQSYRQAGGSAHLMLIGGGPELPALRVLAERLGVGECCHFLGYRPRLELKHYMAASRLFVFASQTETQGLVLLEAAAAGLPVVAVRASGVSEAVDDQRTGLLLPAEPGAMVKALLEIDSDEPRRLQWAEQSRAWAESFSSEEMARKMVDLYTSVQTRRA